MTVALAMLMVSGTLGTSAVLTERVQGKPTRQTTRSCVFLIRARVVGGGTQTTCLTRVDGFPGPHATIHSAGSMSFALRKGSIRTRVRITMRFAADGVHAHQAVQGSITGGSRAYRRARGTISGGGTVVDRPTGLGLVDLRYTLALG